MLAIFLRAAQVHTGQRSIGYAKVKWSENVHVHCYESDPTAFHVSKPLRRSSSQPKKRFRNECEAVNSNRLQAKNNILKLYCSLLPRLQRYDLQNMSTADMESKLIQITEEMDSLRRVDSDTGDFCKCTKYTNLEIRLLLLLEALDCLTRKAYIESLPSIPDDIDNRGCFLFF